MINDDETPFQHAIPPTRAHCDCTAPTVRDALAEQLQTWAAYCATHAGDHVLSAQTLRHAFSDLGREIRTAARAALAAAPAQQICEGVAMPKACEHGLSVRECLVCASPKRGKSPPPTPDDDALIAEAHEHATNARDHWATREVLRRSAARLAALREELAKANSDYTEVRSALECAVAGRDAAVAAFNGMENLHGMAIAERDALIHDNERMVQRDTDRLAEVDALRALVQDVLDNASEWELGTDLHGRLIDAARDGGQAMTTPVRDALAEPQEDSSVCPICGPALVQDACCIRHGPTPDLWPAYQCGWRAALAAAPAQPAPSYCTHAWEYGSRRVGCVFHCGLPRAPAQPLTITTWGEQKRKMVRDAAPAQPNWCVGPADRKRPCGKCGSPPGSPCALAAAPAQPAPADALREEFESGMADHVAAGSEPGEFDAMAGFWFDRTGDGRYEIARIDDAWLGYRLAADALAARDATIDNLQAKISSLRAERDVALGTLSEQEERAERAEAERDALRADAERYQFIRDADRSDPHVNELSLYAMESLDEYIDNAMRDAARDGVGNAD